MPTVTNSIDTVRHPLGKESLPLPLDDEKRLKERLQFEELISRLSATFVNLPPERVEMEIEEGLKLIGEFLHAERCTLLRHTKEGGQIEVTFSWICKELDPRRNIFPWKQDSKLMHTLQTGQEYAFNRVADIPAEWSDLRTYITKAQVKSSLILPLNVGGRFLGGMGIDFFSFQYPWPTEVVAKLRFIADVFANALSRKISQEILENTLTELAKVKKQLEADCTYLRNEIKLEHNFDEIIGQSFALKDILSDVEKVAPTDATVLIQGETGTGKELFARAVHQASRRAKRPMVKVNCAALPPNIIESELFGHEKGAFTGAMAKLKGRFELADGGTLFLDEISELPLEVQSKLLRVIQEGELERLGSPHSIKVDVRLIAATNRDLEKEVASGRFLKDLWYRINVFPVTIPPLRERSQDIPMLVEWFAKKLNRKHAKSIDRIPKETMAALKQYAWPGNVRELQNVIERAIIISHSNTLTIDMPKSSCLASDNCHTLDEVERAHIHMVLKKTRWRVSGNGGAATILGLHPNTLRWRMKKLGIEKALN